MSTSSRFASYALDRKLASGSYGEVWIARDRGGRTVALKILHESVLGDGDSLRRFERESRAAIALRHPHLVAAFESGASEGRPFLASEFVPGGSLQDLLDREGRLTLAKSLAIFGDIFRGLEAIHGAGLVHRDLKPANVLLDRAGRAKIADLGLARPTAVQRTLLTVEGEIVGTPAFMSPEQITHGGDVDIRADLYSAGVMLYRSLTGELPFVADDVLGLLKAHVAEAPPDPARRVALPRDLAQLVRALMSKRREDRPSTPAAALALLERSSAEGDGARTAPATTLSDAGPATQGDASALPATILNDAPPAATLPEEQVDATLPLDPHESSAPALRLRDESGAILFLHAARELVLGRDAARGDPRRICMRLLPAAEHAADSLRLSGKHLALRQAADQWLVRDLGSTHGTRLDGAQLDAHAEAELRDGASLLLAGVLELRVRLLARARRPDGSSETHVAPSLLLERTQNGVHQRTLLVASAVALGLAARPVSVGSGASILAAENESLRWLALERASLDPVPIQPDDAKT